MNTSGILAALNRTMFLMKAFQSAKIKLRHDNWRTNVLWLFRSKQRFRRNQWFNFQRRDSIHGCEHIWSSTEFMERISSSCFDLGVLNDPSYQPTKTEDLTLMMPVSPTSGDIKHYFNHQVLLNNTAKPTKHPERISESVRFTLSKGEGIETNYSPRLLLKKYRFMTRLL